MNKSIARITNKECSMHITQQVKILNHQLNIQPSYWKCMSLWTSLCYEIYCWPHTRWPLTGDNQGCLLFSLSIFLTLSLFRHWIVFLHYQLPPTWSIFWEQWSLFWLVPRLSFFYKQVHLPHPRKTYVQLFSSGFFI